LFTVNRRLLDVAILQKGVISMKTLQSMRISLAAVGISLVLPAAAIAADDAVTMLPPTPIEVTGAQLSADQVRAGLDRLGYEEVSGLQNEGQYYWTQAVYEGKTYPLEIDAVSGEVTPIAVPQVSGVDVTYEATKTITVVE
jgi:hypothetical protein